jgi:hypothetical protein
VSRRRLFCGPIVSYSSHCVFFFLFCFLFFYVFFFFFFFFFLCLCSSRTSLP